MEHFEKLEKARTVKSALKVLQDMTSDEIADYLREHDIKGASRPNNCPMAILLRTKTRHRVYVTLYAIELNRVVFSPKIYKCPASVSEFISVFDMESKYDDLHLEAERKIKVNCPIQF